MHVDSINGMVDVYDVYLLSGQLYKTIYINMYGTKTSTKIPIGFSFKSIADKEVETKTELLKKGDEKKKIVITRLHIFILVLIGIVIFMSGILVGICLDRTALYEIEDTSFEPDEIDIGTDDNIDEKYPIYRKAHLLVSDPYGLSNKYSIIGENINDILGGYSEGEDYEVERNEVFCSYILSKKAEYWYEKEATITIYTEPDDDIVRVIDYSFKVDWFGNSGYLRVNDIKKELTDYYDADPSYRYFDGKETVDTTRTEFEKLFKEGYMGIYHITWRGEKGEAKLTMQNLYEEKSEEWNISFADSTRSDFCPPIPVSHSVQSWIHSSPKKPYLQNRS
jgi:hypothetical protein